MSPSLPPSLPTYIQKLASSAQVTTPASSASTTTDHHHDHSNKAIVSNDDEGSPTSVIRLLVRLSHQYAVGEDNELSQSVLVNLARYVGRYVGRYVRNVMTNNLTGFCLYVHTSFLLLSLSLTCPASSSSSPSSGYCQPMPSPPSQN